LFSEAPASGFQSFLSVTRKDQLSRTDKPDSFLVFNVAGSWSLTGKTATFTSTENILSNTRYQIEVNKNLRSTSGRLIETPIKQQFSSLYDPYYVDIRVIKSRLRSEAQNMSDDLINYFIYIASLDAKAKYQSWLLNIPNIAIYPFGTTLAESTVRDSGNLSSYGVNKWTEACTLYEIYSSILVDELRNIGRDRKLADYSESLSNDFNKAIQMAKDKAKEDMEYWDGYIIPDATLNTTSRMYDYDESLIWHDASLDDYIKNRGQF
jgi:hypothetical protein